LAASHDARAEREENTRFAQTTERGGIEADGCVTRNGLVRLRAARTHGVMTTAAAATTSSGLITCQAAFIRGGT